MMNILVYQFICLALVMYFHFAGCVSSQAVPVNEKEVSVGSVISIKLNHPRSKKTLKALMPNWLVSTNSDTVYEGIPTGNDVGVHVIPELNLAVRVKPESSTFEHCSNRLSPTGVLVAIDAEPSRLSPRARVNLLRSFASHLQLGNDTRLRLLSSSASAALQTYLYRLASGPGDVPAVRRASAGGFIAWRVGCGAIPASGLDMLQRMEKSAVTGELHRVIGYSVLHWLVGDDHTRAMLLRRRRLLLRRKRAAEGTGTPGSSSPSAGAGNAEEEPGSGMTALGSSMEGSGVDAGEKPGTKSPQKVSGLSTSNVGSTKAPGLSSTPVGEEGSKVGGNASLRPGQATAVPATAASVLSSSTVTTSTSTTTTTTTTRAPTTPPDSIPVIVHELKKIVLVAGDRLSFIIPRSAFNDTEDGSMNLQLKMFDSDGTSPVGSSIKTKWISFDKTTGRMSVSVTANDKGSYKFLVCAYDTKDNKICGPQMIDVKVEASLKTEFEVCKGEHFQRFLRQDERAYLEKKLSNKPMELQISSSVHNLDWIKFDAKGRIFYGLPPPNWTIATSEFNLTATNRRMNERTRLTFKVHVKPARMDGITHKFQISLRFPSNTKESSLPYLFASSISNATDLSIDKVMILSVDVNTRLLGRLRYRRSTGTRNATIVWTDRRQVSLTECPDSKIRAFVKQVVSRELITGTLIYQKSFKDRMSPFLLMEPFKADGIGPCEGRSFLPPLPTTTSTTTTTPTPTTTTTATTTTLPRVVTVIPPYSSLTSLSVFTGLAFRSRLKLNKVDMDPRIFSVIFTSPDQVTIPRSSWIQLEESDLSLYGLPLKRSEGTSAFSLTILSRNGTQDHAILPLNVSVVRDEREHLVNNLVRMQLRKYKTPATTESFRKPVLYALKFRLDLVRLLGTHLEGTTCTGSSCEKNIAIRQMSVDAEGNLVFEWSWRAMYESADCDKSKLKHLNTRLLAWNGSARVVLQSLKNALRKLQLVATSVSVMPQGSCRVHGTRKESTPAPKLNMPYTRRPSREQDLRRMIPNFLVVAVIPICAFLILVLVVALIVACCLHHKRKMHMRRRRGIDKPKPDSTVDGAVVFEEEMDEHPNHASKPLILPNEKPPLPPPDYATEVMPPPLGHEEHIPLTTTSPYRHATNGGSTFRPDQPPMINT